MSSDEPCPESGTAQDEIQAVRIVTPQAREVIRRAQGLEYEAMIVALLRLNPGASRSEASAALRELIGPWSMAALFEEPRTLRYVPDIVYVGPERRPFELLATNPRIVLECTAARASFHAAVVKNFRSLAFVRQLRAEHIKEGGDSEAFDQFTAQFVARANREWEETIRRAYEGEGQPRSGRAGCGASSLLLILVTILLVALAIV